LELFESAVDVGDGALDHRESRSQGFVHERIDPIVNAFVDAFVDVMDEAHRGSGLVWDFGKTLVKQTRSK